MYPEKTYPNYLSGTGYVMSLDVASKLYKSALVTPLLHLEDVFITGMCAKRSKLRPVNHPGFSYVQRKMDTCLLRDVITSHKVNITSMYTMWSKLNETRVSCTNHTAPERKAATVSKYSKHSGYYLAKSRTINKCV